MFKTKFDDSYMGGFWDHIKFWWFLRRLKNMKKKALWEANVDKYFFETNMKEQLGYDDTEDRKVLQAESFKPEGNRDNEAISAINTRVSDSKAIKQAYRKNEAFIEDIKTYIDMLENFNEETKA